MGERIATGPMAPRNDNIIDVPVHQQRSLATVTAEIRTIRAARDKMFLEASVEIGRRLKEAKELVGHGGWGDYCKAELDFSQQTAQNHIRLFEAYAADQIRLDGAALKSKTLGDLSYTQALELLALPSEEEREAFVASHDLGSMSTRELREELRKRQQAQDGDDEGALLAEQFGTGAAPQADNDEAEAEAEAEAELLRERLEAAQKDRLEAISQMDQAQMQGEEYRRRAIKAEEDLKFATKVKDAMKAKSDEAERQAQAAAEKMADMEKQLREARKTENAAVKALQEAKENPNIPSETLEKLRREAEEAARKALEAESGGQSLQEAREQYAKAEQEAAEARQEAARARQEAERLEKELRMAEPKVAVFRDRFAGLQGDLSALIVSIDELPADKQAGARKGVRAILQNALNMVQEPEKEGENHG